MDPSHITCCPEDVQVVPVHFSEDLYNLDGLMHGSFIPCSEANLSLWPKQSLHCTP